MTKIPRHAVVFVGDGRKALFFRNEGDEKFLNLTVEVGRSESTVRWPMEDRLLTRRAIN